MDSVLHAKLHGGPWWCPVCGRVTVDVYRCSNGSCAADLAGQHLDAVKNGRPDELPSLV